jgi:hypothetical protein
MKDFRQEIFTKVKTHLLTQNKKCVDDKGDPRLRNQNNKCAASCLIPDNDYSEKMEPCHFWNFFRDSGYSQKELDLIQELVCIHDSQNPITWKNQLKDLAENEGLNF